MADKEPQQSRVESPLSTSLHATANYGLVIVGLALLFLGWYGISGTAQVGEQLPILASASLPGVGLVVAGAVLIASDRTRRSNEHAAATVERLAQLLTEAASSPTTATTNGGESDTSVGGSNSSSSALVAVETGTRYHRPDCALVTGKRGLLTVDSATTAQRELEPCPICEPLPPRAATQA